MTGGENAKPVEGKPRRPRRRSWLRRFVLAALLFVATAIAFVAVPPLRNNVTAPALVAVARRIVAGESGELRVAGFAGNGWNELELTGVDVRLPGTALRELRSSRIALRYSLRQLLDGLDGLAAVEVDDLRLALDLSQPSTEPAPEEESAPFTLPARLPSVALRSLDLMIDLPGSSNEPGTGEQGADARRTGLHAIQVTSESIEIEPSVGASQGITLAGVRVELREADSERAHQLAVEGRYTRGRFRSKRVVLDGREVLGSGVIAVGESLSGAVEDAVLAWDVRALPFAGGVTIAGALTETGLTAQVATDALDLDALAQALSESLSGVPELRGSLALEADLVLDLDAPTAAAGRVEVGILGPAYGESAFDRLELSGKLDAGRLSDWRGRLTRGSDELRWNDLELELDDLAGPDALSAASGELTLGASNLPGWLADWIEIPEGRVPDHRLDLRVDLQGPEGALLGGRLSVKNGGEVELIRGALRPPVGSAGSREGDLLEALLASSVETELAVDVPDLFRFGQLFGRADWRGALNGKLDLRGLVSAPVGTLLVDGQAVDVAGVDLGTVTVLAGVDRDGLEIGELEANGSVGQLKASGRFAFTERLFEDVALAVTVVDPSVLGLAAAEAENARLELSGDLSGRFDAPEGKWQLVGHGLAVSDALQLNQLEARGTVADGIVRLEELEVETPQASLGAAARLERPETGAGWVATIERLDLASGTSRLALAAPARVEFGDGPTRVRGIELSGTEERLFVDGWLDSREALPTWEGRVEARMGPLLEAFQPWLGAETHASSLELDLRGARQGSETTAAVRLVVEELRTTAGLAPGRLDLEADLAERRVTLRSGVLDLGDGTHIDLTGTWPFDPARPAALPDGVVELSGRFDVPRIEEFVPSASGAASATIRGEGEAQALRLTADVDFRALAWRGGEPVPGRGQPIELGPFDGKAQLAWAERLELSAIKLSAPGLLEFEANGHAELSADLTRLHEVAFAEQVLELDVVAKLPDLAPFAQWTQSVYSARGSAGVELALRGTASEPDASGTIDVRDATLKLASDLPALSEIQAELRFDGDELRFDRFTGEMGGAPFSVDGAVALAGAGGGAEANVRMVGKNLLLVRKDGVKVRSNASLTIEGPLAALTVSGDLGLQDCRFVKNVDFLRIGRGEARPDTGARGFSLFSFREPPLADLRFDIAVTADQPFRLQNNVVRGGLRPDLHLGGTGLAPQLSGPIYLDPTTVSLPASRLRMTAGTIRFEGESWRGPQLQLVGEARTRGYDVSIAISGVATDPQVTLSSIPPLPREDLIVLLLTGQTPETGDSRSGAQSVAMFLALDAGSRWFSDESTEAEESLVDRVDVFSGGDVTESGAETVEVSFRITDDDQAQRLTYLTAERDVYDRINFGLRFLFRLP